MLNDLKEKFESLGLWSASVMGTQSMDGKCATFIASVPCSDDILHHLDNLGLDSDVTHDLRHKRRSILVGTVEAVSREGQLIELSSTRDKVPYDMPVVDLRTRADLLSVLDGNILEWRSLVKHVFMGHAARHVRETNSPDEGYAPVPDSEIPKIGERCMRIFERTLERVEASERLHFRFDATCSPENAMVSVIVDRDDLSRVGRPVDFAKREEVSLAGTDESLHWRVVSDKLDGLLDEVFPERARQQAGPSC